MAHLNCYVIVQTTHPQHIDNEGRRIEAVAEDDEFTTTTSTSSEAWSHIGKIVKPSEIKEPQNLQEIINFIGSNKLSNTEVMEPTNEEGGEDTVTYTQLMKIVALWQLAREQNFYEMQTEGGVILKEN
uniref:Uncharacterized protein n=1 Tax=Musca domestica TaxID=7370 RepID=T1P9H7_MUSDO